MSNIPGKSCDEHRRPPTITTKRATRIGVNGIDKRITNKIPT
jgi:hypothetical protein